MARRSKLLEQFQPFRCDRVLIKSKAGDVAAGMRHARDEPAAHRVAHLHEYDGYRLRCLFQGHQGSRGASDDDVWLQADQFDRSSAQALGLATAPANIEPGIAVVPAELLKFFPERRKPILPLRIAFAHCHQHADASQLPRLLRAHRERPRDRRAAEQRDELAPVHSIISSARASNDGGTVRPSTLAACKIRLRFSEVRASVTIRIASGGSRTIAANAAAKSSGSRTPSGCMS